MFPLLDRVLQLFVGVGDCHLGLLPLEAGLSDPVAHLCCIIEQLLQPIFSLTAILPVEDLAKQFVLFSSQFLQLPGFGLQLIDFFRQRLLLFNISLQVFLGNFLESTKILFIGNQIHKGAIKKKLFPCHKWIRLRKTQL